MFLVPSALRKLSNTRRCFLKVVDGKWRRGNT